MQRLRIQVDRIDLKLLQLLQQRTKLSRRIGETKRRHGAVIYVPEREREVLSRVTHLSRGKLPPRAAVAIFREILSSSRAEQGQAPIGVLQASADKIIPPARWCFGACDEFQLVKSWSDLAEGLKSGSLLLALLTGEDLIKVLRGSKVRRQFLERVSVAGDLPSGRDASLAETIFILRPRVAELTGEANRTLILIECKSTMNAVKTWLKSMPNPLTHLDSSSRSQTVAGLSGSRMLVLLRQASSLDMAQVTEALHSSAISFSVLGTYHGLDDYAR
jgi:chorismate mutase